MSIYQLINEIDNKELVLPAIQRDFVWDTDRIRLLFDSMMRGYPIGIVLLWETYQPIQFRYFDTDFRPDVLHKFEDNTEENRKKLVLDGQQRLSSIFVALRGRHEGRGLYLDVLSGRDKDDFSEEKYDFQFYTPGEVGRLNATSKKVQQAYRKKVADEEPPRYYVQVPQIIGKAPNELLQLREKIAKQLTLNEADKLRMEGNLLNLSHALTGDSEILKTQTIDSKLPSDDKKRKSAFDVLEIFVRINTQGVPLSRSDLIVSMLRLYWKETSELLPAFLKDINDGSGLDIDTDFVIRCMFSVAGIGTRLDFDLLRKRSNVDKLRGSYRTCFEAIRAAVDFVRSDCHIDSKRLLGGNTLVPFVQYLYSAPKQSFPHGNRADAIRTLYLFAFSKVFFQHSESRTGAFIRDYLPTPGEVRKGSPFSYKEAVKYTYFTSYFDAADDRLFANNPELALALIQRKSGGKIKHSGNSPEIDHIFPRAMLREKEGHEINDLGNLWILPRTLNRNKSATHPKDYLKKVDSAFLKNALIRIADLNLHSYRNFITRRRMAVAKKLRQTTGLTDKEFLEVKKESREE